MKKGWLYYITPFTLGSLFCLIGICAEIDGMIKDEMWAEFGLDLYAAFLAMLLISDYLLRSATKGKLLYIWIIEVVIISLLTFWLCS